MLKQHGFEQAGEGISAHGRDDLLHDAGGTAINLGAECQSPQTDRQGQRRDRDGAEHLLNRFYEMQQMMRKMGKMQKLMARMGGGGAGLFRSINDSFGNRE
jgi:hypothetical protein